MRNGYVIVYRDNLMELAQGVVYEQKDVAMDIMKVLQSLATRQLDVQPIDVDTRKFNQLAR